MNRYFIYGRRPIFIALITLLFVILLWTFARTSQSDQVVPEYERTINTGRIPSRFIGLTTTNTTTDESQHTTSNETETKSIEQHIQRQEQEQEQEQVDSNHINPNSLPSSSSDSPDKLHPNVIKALQVMNDWSQLAGYNNQSLTSSVFPPLIHTKWNNEQSIPSRARECVNGWKDKNPDHTVIIWTDESTDQFMKHMYPHWYPVWSTLPRPVMKIDVARIAFLASFGGTWADIDACPLKPISNWSIVPGDGLVIGVEADMESPVWPRYFARQFQFETWTFAAIPGHPALMQYLHMTYKAVTNRRQYPTGNYIPPVSDNDVLDLTGPGMFTDAMFTYLHQHGNASFNAMHFMDKPMRFNDAVVMPLWVFSPGSIQTASSRPNYSRNHLDPEAMVLHLFLGSWRDGKY